MKFRKMLRIMAALLSATLIVSGTTIALSVSDGYAKGKQKYRKWKELYTDQDDDAHTGQAADTEETGQTEAGDLQGNTEDSLMEDMVPEDAPERMTIDFDSLLELNPDVVGWIELPAVNISYPVVQGEDNEYYLHRSLDREPLFAGCLFLDADNASDFLDQNSIIYGHNMRDGTMFANLKAYNEESIYEQCPYFWLYTPDMDYLYQIVAVHLVPVSSTAYSITFESDTAYDCWLEEMKDASVIHGDTDEGTTTVTLSTCTGNDQQRQVVQGVRVSMVEKESSS
jgi:sortase B